VLLRLDNEGKIAIENYVSYHEGKRMDLKTGHPTLGAFIVDKKRRSELVYSERLFMVCPAWVITWW
jgi:hypothetical protein